MSLFSFKLFDQTPEQLDNVNNDNIHSRIEKECNKDITTTNSNSNYTVTENTKETEVSQQDKIEPIVSFNDNNHHIIHDNSKQDKVQPSLLGKKTLFTSKKSQYTYKKEIKLIQNRMSAKKCRQKKKQYIETLENELKKYKLIVAQYQQMFARLAPLIGKIQNDEIN